jgi:hypothetical protein
MITHKLVQSAAPYSQVTISENRPLQLISIPAFYSRHHDPHADQSPEDRPRQVAYLLMAQSVGIEGILNK